MATTPGGSWFGGGGSWFSDDENAHITQQLLRRADSKGRATAQRPSQQQHQPHQRQQHRLSAGGVTKLPLAGQLASSGRLSGHLHKLGDNVRRWKRRFFVLEPATYLYYYLSSGDDEPAGCLNLDLYTDCEFVNSNEFEPSTSQVRSRESVSSQEEGRYRPLLLPAPPAPPGASSGARRPSYASAKGWSALPAEALTAPALFTRRTLRLRRPDTGHAVVLHARSDEEAAAWRQALDPSQRHGSLRSRVALLEDEARELTIHARALDDDLQTSRLSGHECRKALATERAFRRDLVGRLVRDLGSGLGSCARGKRFDEGIAEAEAEAAAAKELAAAVARDEAAINGRGHAQQMAQQANASSSDDAESLGAGFADAIGGAFVQLPLFGTPSGHADRAVAPLSKLSNLDLCPGGDDAAAASERAACARACESLVGLARDADQALAGAQCEARAATKEAHRLRSKLATLAEYALGLERKGAQQALALAQQSEASNLLTREKRALTKECRRLREEAADARDAARDAAKASQASAKTAAARHASAVAQLTAKLMARVAASEAATTSQDALSSGGEATFGIEAPPAEPPAEGPDDADDNSDEAGLPSARTDRSNDVVEDETTARVRPQDRPRPRSSQRSNVSTSALAVPADDSAVFDAVSYDAKQFRRELRLAIARAVDQAKPQGDSVRASARASADHPVALAAFLDHGVPLPRPATALPLSPSSDEHLPSALAAWLFPSEAEKPVEEKEEVPKSIGLKFGKNLAHGSIDGATKGVSSVMASGDSGLFLSSVLGSLGLGSSQLAGSSSGSTGTGSAQDQLTGAASSSQKQPAGLSPLGGKGLVAGPQVREFGLFAYRVVYRGGVGVRPRPDASLPLSTSSDILPFGSAFVARERRLDPATGLTYVRVGGGTDDDNEHSAWVGSTVVVDGSVAGWVFEASALGVTILERGSWQQEVHTRVEVEVPLAPGTASTRADPGLTPCDADNTSDGDETGDGVTGSSQRSSAASSLAGDHTDGLTDCEQEDKEDDSGRNSPLPLSDRGTPPTLCFTPPPRSVDWAATSWEVTFLARKIGIQFKQRGGKKVHGEAVGGVSQCPAVGPAVVVSKLSDCVSFGPSQRLPREGSVLVGLNGEDLRGQDWRLVGDKLRLATDRPLRLRFDDPIDGLKIPLPHAAQGEAAVASAPPLPPPEGDFAVLV